MEWRPDRRRDVRLKEGAFTLDMRCNPPAGCPDQPPVVGMAYVPWQQLQTVYEPDRGYTRGTVFPDLDKPFLAGGRGV